ncbi:MAG: ATP-binding cassette domain-containing protein [bacterium]|nr:ATP-binding cassette domain-containing protein [bacterium]
MDFAVRRHNGFAVELPALGLAPGEVVALYGPSGCGKTSMLMALLGVLVGAETSGRVEFRGREVSCLQGSARREFLRNEVIYLAQEAHSALDPLTAIGRQIEDATGRTEVEVRDALMRLGVDPGVAQRLPHQVSGGQAQRALIAMAELRQPALVIADEPSASLDGGSYGELLMHLRRLLEGGSAVLMATHDHRLLRDLEAVVYAATAGRFERADIASEPWPERIADPDVGKLPVLAAHGLHKVYGPRAVLDGMDFEIQRGEIVAVIGESGAGKTTLARVLAGHVPADRGSVDRPERLGAVQLCCQDALASMTPGMTLAQMVGEACTPFFDLEGTCRALHIDPRVLDQVGATMSGGERRRAIILRALAVHPDVLILDEPTASLDRDTASGVLRSLLELQENRGLAIIFITHDVDLARALAHRVVEVLGGRLVEC